MAAHGETLALNGGRPVRDKPYPWPIYGTRERQALLDVLESGRWSFDGPREDALAHAFSSLLTVDHALLVSSGTAALEIALEALELRPGDEVILPALTWTAPARAIVVNRGVPVFADIDPHTWCLTPETIAAAITEHTRGILVVHTYAHVADMDGVLDVAQAHGLFVVEDCAHTLGSRWRGRPVGSMGDIGCFSFQQSKAITAGEGGMVATSDPWLADRMYGLKNCGRKRTPTAEWGFGGNRRMTEFQAAVLLAQLTRLEEQIDAKARQVHSFSAGVDSISGLTVHPPDQRITRRNFVGLPVSVDIAQFAEASTRLLVAALAAEGIPVYLPHPVVYRAPAWLAGTKYHRDPHRLGLNAHCPVGERIATAEGMVIAHEAFLGSWAETMQLLEAFEKVRSLADTIPTQASDTRRI